jgi:hypothetical protein
MNTDKKKKLILPAFMAVLCAVMMIGVGYAALTSSFTTTASVDAGELEVTVGSEGSAVFDDVKIPYGVNTVRSGATDTKTYYVAAGTYDFVKNKTVTIADNTEGFVKYKVTVSVECDKLTALGLAPTATLKDSQGVVASGNTTTEKTLTLDIALTLDANKDVTDDIVDLKTSPASIKLVISVEGLTE